MTVSVTRHEKKVIKIPRATKKAKYRLIKTVLKYIILVFILLSLLVLGTAAGIIYSCYRSLPDISALEKFQPGETTRIYASNGELVAELYEENRTWVPLKKMPKDLVNAFLSIEDDKFYSHHGISIKGILRALWANLREKGMSQGASTITQQLARNLFLSQEQSYGRKISEMLLSIQIEKKFSKDEILELYLNQIFLGSGSFGVEAAARTYFGKSVTDVDLGQSAVLAGLPQAPSVFSPFVDIKACKERQTLVLNRMKELSMIAPEEAKKYIEKPVKTTGPRELGFKGFRMPYFSTYCLHELVAKYGSDVVYRGGLKVYSTLDIPLQEYAQTALRKGIDLGIQEYAYCSEGALVCVENKTGFIRVMAGGYDYNQKNQFNRAWQAKRQPGSSFKIFVYTAAVNSGISPDTVFSDSPTTFTSPEGEAYTPQNSDGRFMGSMRMRDALRLSRNVISVKILEQVGIDNVIKYAHTMGIQSELKPYLSLALGSAEVTVLEMSSAVSILGNMGTKFEATTIKKITDSDGNIVEDNSNRKGIKILPAETAYNVTDMLRGVIESGTGANAYIGRPAAGKTGTTSDYRDAWFVGYTPDYSTAVWIGNDDFSPMERVYGGDYPAMIWSDFMKKAHEKLPVAEFDLPKGDYVEAEICPESGLIVSSKCPSSAKRRFEKGTEPKKSCELKEHKGWSVDNTKEVSQPSPVTVNTPEEDDGKIQE
jgi:penicillin-binding protein 1A